MTLTHEQLATLTIRDLALTYTGDATLLRLGIQAYALGIAFEFDPYFGLSISRVDPLPHQLEAVYDYLLKLPQVRFLLADDAFQWQRELRDKFDEQFEVLKGPDLREQYGINQWLERTQIITSLDLAKRIEILPGLRSAQDN